MKVSKSKLITILLSLSILVLFLYNYIGYLQPLYAYRGAGELIYDIDLVLKVLCIFAILLAIPKVSVYPSDFFVIIFLYYKVIWLALLSGLSDFGVYIYEYVFYIVLIGFYVSIRKLRFNSVKLNLKSDLSAYGDGLVFALLYFGLSAVVFIFYLWLLEWHLDFSFLNFHERRANFKIQVGSGGFAAYFYGLAQALFVLSLYLLCVQKRIKHALVFIGMFSLIWGGAGERYLFVIMAFVIFLAILNKKNRSVRFQRYMIYFFVALFGFSIVEANFTGFALIADYVLGRMLVVPQFISDAWTSYTDQYSFNAYCDSGIGAIWCAERTQGLPYVVSATILGDEKMNANTDFIKIAYARGGIFGAMLEAGVVGVVLLYINHRFVKTGSSLYVVFAVLFALRTVEQAVSVSFLSTGLLFFLILIELRSLKFKAGLR